MTNRQSADLHHAPWHGEERAVESGRLIHLVGDSTVADGKPHEFPLAGWGGYLHERLDEPVQNWAVGGARTETFFAHGWWGELARHIHPGDTVLIQFGHNDQKEPELLAARGGYTDRLSRMVALVRDHGADPVLCTSVERRYFDGERIVPSHGDYPNAVRDLAAHTGTHLIDLAVFSTWLYEDLGPEGSRALLSHYSPGEFAGWPDGLMDETHFREEGGRRIAAYVALAIRAIERRDGDRPARMSDR